jgi:hypothetical protein
MLQAVRERVAKMLWYHWHNRPLCCPLVAGVQGCAALTPATAPATARGTDKSPHCGLLFARYIGNPGSNRADSFQRRSHWRRNKGPTRVLPRPPGTLRARNSCPSASNRDLDYCSQVFEQLRLGGVLIGHRSNHSKSPPIPASYLGMGGVQVRRLFIAI